MGVKRSVSYQSGESMAKKTDEELYDVAINMIGSVAKLPVIRVDREAFLRQQFAGSEYLDEILEHGPQHVYTAESLRRKADGLIKKSTNQTTLAAFVAGIPGGPAAVAAGGADVAQYFGFAINLAQKIAYLFGEDDLFTDESELNEGASPSPCVFGCDARRVRFGDVGRKACQGSRQKHGQEDHATGFDENDLVSTAQENRRDGWQTGGEGVGWQGRCQGCARCWRCHFRGDNLCDV